MTSKLSRPAALGSRALLDRILDQPGLVAALESLPAEALGKLIEHVGLEDAGEIVALATTEQLCRVFDEDLWRSPRPGQDEVFDAERFGRWLEIMLEAGEENAARRIVEVPEDLFTLALHKQVLVVDLDALAVVMANRMSDDDALLEKALESCLCEEIGQYRIIARRSEGWDALLSLLLVLDRDHHDYLERVLERCCYASNDYVEENGGLYDVLTSEEMLEADAAAEREDRRAEAGYVSPSSAAAFLALARTAPMAEVLAAAGPDPITQAYFRSLGRTPDPVAPQAGRAEASPAGSVPDAPARDLLDLLRAAEVLPATGVGLLAAASPAAADGEQDLLGRTLRDLSGHAPEQHARRMAELAYLANVLHAGCSLEGRRFRPGEAARAVVATCNLGLVHCREQRSTTAEAALAAGADKLFRVAWRLLFERAALPSARALAGRLTASVNRRHAASAAAGRALAALQAALAAGRPWTARTLLQGLGESVDPVLLAAMDECPHLGGGLAAPAGGKSDAAAGLAFIATGAELRSLEKTIAATARR